MRSILLASAAILALAPAVAMAQSPNSASEPNTTQNQPANSAQPLHLRSNLRNALEKAGYKDIKVAPTSFMVRARDNDGNPVVMAISPDSFTEVAEAGSGGNSPSTTGTVSSHAASPTFVSVPQADELSSKVVGLDIYNNDKDIGQIKDIAMNPNGRSQAYIVSVGGFLGMGEHYVAVNSSDVKVSYNDQDKKWHASMNANAGQLKSAPEFKYTGRWQSKT